MRWQVELTDEAEMFYLSLTDAQRVRVAAAIEDLEVKGPATGMPHCNPIKSSRHPTMHELRPRGGHLRLLFAFDPRRTAIVLIGGDKTGDWIGWYDTNVPIADNLHDTYLDELREEGVI